MTADMKISKDAGISALNTFEQALEANRAGHSEDAIRLFDQWLAEHPQDAAALTNVGNILALRGQHAAAIALFRRAIAIAPGLAGAWTGLGNTLSSVGRYEESIAAHDHVISLSQAPSVNAIYNRAITLKMAGHLADALREFRRVRALSPEHVESRFQESQILLQQGDFANGWLDYEARFLATSMPVPTAQARRWSGERRAEQTLLLLDEQGFGDALQGVRFALTARARVGRVILSVRPELTRLFRTVAGVDLVCAKNEFLPPIDLECPLMSLPGVLGVTLADLPGKIPYVSAPPPSPRLKGALGRLAPGLKVGLVWAGSATHIYDRQRSVQLERLLNLLEIPGISFVSLQKGESRAALAAIGSTTVLPDWGAFLDDFADTAAAIKALDLVISVDTSVVHLAGALGVPVWILLKHSGEWRWLRDREDSPWYPSARLFQQRQPGDWDDVIARVSASLKQASRSQSTTNLSLQPAKDLRLPQPQTDVTALTASSDDESPAVEKLAARLQTFQERLRREPGDPGHWGDLGSLARAMNKHATSVAAFRRACELDGANAHVWENAGLAFKRMGEVDEAVRALEVAMELSGERVAKILYNMSVVLRDARRWTDALDMVDRVLDLNPDYVSGKFHRSLVLLALGDYARGWPAYEARWKTSALNRRKIRIDAAQWNGEAFPGKKLLLYNEQGHGDAIQFIRYAAMVKGRGGSVTLAVPDALKRLMSTAPGVDEIVGSSGTIMNLAYECPLMSLPKVFGTTLDTIPAKIPYLFGPPLEGKLAAAVRAQAGKFKIGIAWAGNPKHHNDHRRSTSLALFQRLIETPGTRFFSLLKGSQAREIDELGLSEQVTDLNELITDFADTAAVINELDLVISVDTSAAHLAGAMGKPVWLLLEYSAEWRWLTERDDTPWYPTMRLFRQDRSGDWVGLFARVEEALKELAATQRAGHAIVHQVQNRWADARTLDREGRRLIGEGKSGAAVITLRRAIEADPSSAESWSDLGIALDHSRRTQEALHAHARAVELSAGRSQRALFNLSIAYRNAGRVTDALDAISRVLALDSSNAQAKWHEALLHLQAGDFAKGWPAFEMRTRPTRPKPKGGIVLPWDGKPLQGKSLIVFDEQKTSDAIQFARFLARVPKIGGRIVVETDRQLFRLLQTVRGVDGVVAHGAATEGYDYQCSLQTLPLLLGLTDRHALASGPYVRPQPLKSGVEAKIGSCGKRLKIVIAWAGSAGPWSDTDRRVLFDLFLTLHAVAGLSLFNVQKGAPQRDIEDAAAAAIVIDLADDMSDAADVASVVAESDLVISVDAMVAHIAGALGKPIWILLPTSGDWRWQTEDRTSPWYPSARVFQQQRAGDWAEVFARVRDALPVEVQRARKTFALATLPKSQGDSGANAAAPAGGRPSARRNAKHLVGRANVTGRATAEQFLRLGQELSANGRLPAAIAAYRRGLEHDAALLALWLGLAYALRLSGRTAAANRASKKAADLATAAGAVAPANAYKAIWLGNSGREKEALEAAQRAVAADPRNPEFQQLEASIRLRMGDYTNGWPLYESRWKIKRSQSRDIGQIANIKRWHGEPIAGKTILLWCEQGYGDALQFVRLAAECKADGARVILWAPERLAGLLASAPGIDRVTTRQSDFGPIDFQCPLLSLPAALGLTLDQLPGPVPYLTAPELPLPLRQIFAPLQDRYTVGIVWAGRPTHENNRNRSISLLNFIPLLEIEGVELISLQVGPAQKDIAEFGAETLVIDPTSQLADFSATAAIIEALDLVISVDTAVAHLAGALGKPVWLLLSEIADWRWLGRRSDSPWYPTMRLFRQNAERDWSNVFMRVSEELKYAVGETLGARVTRPILALTPTERAARTTELTARGKRLLDAGHHAAAVATFRRALAVSEPNNAPLLSWLGIALEGAGRIDEALDVLARANHLYGPKSVQGPLNLAIAQQSAGNYEQARTLGTQALAVDPRNANTKAFVRRLDLRLGLLEEGWPTADLFEPLRRVVAVDDAAPRDAPPSEEAAAIRRWQGESLAGKSILIHGASSAAELFHSLRFLPLLKRAGARIVIEVPVDSISLVAQAPGVDRAVVRADPPLPTDFECPLGLLPRVMKITARDIAMERPGLTAPRPFASLRSALAGHELRLKVGIVWAHGAAGNAETGGLLQLADFLDLYDVPGVSLFSLQKGAGHDDVAEQASADLVTDLGPMLRNFAEMAAAVSALDLVIAVDSGVAHLAGALSVPVWVVLPNLADWRWHVGREDSPWYPSARLFRQKRRGDWNEVFERVRQALAKRARQVAPRKARH